VIEGAMMERSKLYDKFVRQFTALKSYGTLLAVAEKEAQGYFPNTDFEKVGFVENQDTGRYVIVINWVIVSVSGDRHVMYFLRQKRLVMRRLIF
jgi:hypothetical protein